MGPLAPPYPYFNIGPTGAEDTLANTLTKSQLQQRTNLITTYQEYQSQQALMVIVNYHMVDIINNIIQLLINNTGRTKYVYYLQIPPSLLADNIPNILSTITYASLKPQVVQNLINSLQLKFPDLLIILDRQNTFVILDWT